MDKQKSDKRQGKAAIPDNLDTVLNPAQRHALHQIESFGWQLEFVRQPLFQDPVPVVVSGDGERIGILDADGRIDIQAELKLREATAADYDDTCTGC